MILDVIMTMGWILFSGYSNISFEALAVCRAALNVKLSSNSKHIQTSHLIFGAIWNFVATVHGVIVKFTTGDGETSEHCLIFHVLRLYQLSRQRMFQEQQQQSCNRLCLVGGSM